MRYYLGINGPGNALSDSLAVKLHSYILFSYHYCNNIELAKKLILNNQSNHFIVDSGAFSSWSIGKNINRTELLKFYRAIQEVRPDTVFINLDKIPGSKGNKPTKQQSEEACKISLENYNYLKKYIKNLLPVFHEDDDFSYLEIMKQETDYIAISPANDSHTKKRIQWLDKVYSNLKANYKTHSLAGVGETLLKRYPFYSGDSVSYRSFAMWGRAISKSDEILKMHHTNSNNSNEYTTRVMPNEIKAYKKLQDDITNLWEKRGVKWEK